MQVYQPAPGDVVYVAGQSSTLGPGVLRSNDRGRTWVHLGGTDDETVVFGTSKSVYATNGWNGGSPPSLESAPQPGDVWTPRTAPMAEGPGEVAVTSDGTHSILVAACFKAGLWRYVEP
jgi:hypothetical protein